MRAKELIDGIVKTYGRLDILVNNAGITKDNLIMKMSEDDFDAVIDTNLKGAFNCIRHVSRQMLKQRSGRIINISSVSGVMGNVGQANYCASKAGIIGLTKSVARELGSRGITSNAVAPGFIRTEMTDVLPSAVPGILAGVILGIGRIVGETAALIYTAGTVAALPTNVMSSGRTLAVHMYVLASEGLYMKQAYATAVVLVLIVIGINAASARLAKKLMKGS